MSKDELESFFVYLVKRGYLAPEDIEEADDLYNGWRA
jgi:hypothetical protein